MTNKNWDTYEPTERQPRPVPPLVEFDTHHRVSRWRWFGRTLEAIGIAGIMIGVLLIFIHGDIDPAIFVIAAGVILGSLGATIGDR